MHLCCINGHPVGYFIFLLLRQLLPFPVFPFGELCIRIDDSQLGHPFPSRFANFIPSFLTIDLRKFLNVFFFCLQRPVRSVKCQIKEERFIIFLFIYEADRVIGKCICCIIGCFRLRKFCVVKGQAASSRWTEIAASSCQNSVEAFKSPL